MYVIMGATGNIGSRLANILIHKGKKIKVIGRSAQRLKPFVDRGAESAVGNVSDAAFLKNAFKGCDAAFAWIPPHYTADNYRSFYYENS